jgi:formylglycine-generating enzyme required for sulfatase activity
MHIPPLNGMKKHLLLWFLSVAAAPICAEESSGFAVDLINPSRAFLLVDDAWQQNAECLQVKVSVATEVSDPVLKAYFYGADAKLLDMARAPSRETDGQGNQIKPQLKFEKGRKYEVYFGIPTAAKRWKRAIIVFGKPGDYATKIYPKDDLAKFDFPEKAVVAAAAVPTPAKVNTPVQAAMVSTKKEAVVLGKLSPQVQALKRPFDEQVNEEVEKAYDLGIKDLNQKYIGALERAQEKAQEAGKLEDAVAIKADKEAVAAGNGVPAADDAGTPAIVTQLRNSYRQAISPLEAERLRKLQPLQTSFLKSLDALIVSLTKEGKLDEALTVRNDRENLALVFAEPRPANLGQSRVAKMPTATAAKGTPFVNSLGMKFVAVPGTDVLMCIHETRRKDYAAFASANSRTDDGWKQAVDRGVPVGRGDDDPVVMVNFEDATAFCAWLSRKEGKDYRLPTDREWSMAVGIGDRESPNASPLSLNEKIKDEFPWGKAWPPPKGSVNLRDSSCGKTFPSANGVSNVENYTDGFVTTAPVMSFAPNHLGIYDLAGNVWEWCSDWFEKDKSTHVMRGGNYGSIRGGVLSSYRIGGSAARTPGRGFRCVVISQNAVAAARTQSKDSAAPTSTGVKAPELPWLIGKTWATDAGNTLEFTEGGAGIRTTKSGKTPYTWRIMPSGLVEAVLKAGTPLTLYVEFKSASEGVFGYSEAERVTPIHVK